MVRFLKMFLESKSDLKRRIFVIIIFFVVATVVTFSGTIATNVDIHEAQRVKEELEGEFQRMNDPRFILGNNLVHTLVMFTPVIGPVWGCFVLFNTGRIIALFSIAEGIPPILTFVLLLFSPILWLEFSVYSTAMAQSVMLLLHLVRRSGGREAIRTCVVIALCTIVLLISAFVEWFIINA